MACIRSVRRTLPVLRPLQPQLQLTALRALSSKQSQIIDFSDTKSAFASKSLLHLLRSWAVFRLCSWKTLVVNSDKLVKAMTKVLGKSGLALVLKPTFFGHFCAGEDEATIEPTIKYLRSNGIGSILDYAAEADVSEEDNAKKVAPEVSHVRGDAPPLAPSKKDLDDAGTSQPARTFKYEGEEKCDQNMKIFESCIRAVHNVTPEGFAAVKITALGVPALLERLSTALVQSKALFSSLDSNKDGFVSEDEFVKWHQALYGSGSFGDEKVARSIFNRAIRSISGSSGNYFDEKGLNYVSWSSLWTLRDIWGAMKASNSSGPFADAALNEEEVRLVESMYKRIHTVAALAAEQGVRLMIDAEQTYFQPAIDHATLELQHKHNKVFPTIFGTYQCYLKDAPTRVLADLDRANKYGYLFAAKIVRGAYMKIERDRAAEHGYPSPICDTLQDTHDTYHRVMQYILASKNRNLVVASHNQSSIEFALDYMRKNNIDPANGGVYFAQLLGMADHLTFSLGAKGYKAYKYVPYGPVHEVVPYLIRRAQENGDLIGGSAKKEINMARSEIRRRLF